MALNLIEQLWIKRESRGKWGSQNQYLVCCWAIAYRGHRGRGRDFCRFALILYFGRKTQWGDIRIQQTHVVKAWPVCWYQLSGLWGRRTCFFSFVCSLFCQWLVLPSGITLDLFISSKMCLTLGSVGFSAYVSVFFYMIRGATKGPPKSDFLKKFCWNSSEKCLN